MGSLKRLDPPGFLSMDSTTPSREFSFQPLIFPIMCVILRQRKHRGKNIYHRNKYYHHSDHECLLPYKCSSQETENCLFVINFKPLFNPKPAEKRLNFFHYKHEGNHIFNCQSPDSDMLFAIRGLSASICFTLIIMSITSFIRLIGTSILILLS